MTLNKIILSVCIVMLAGVALSFTHFNKPAGNEQHGINWMTMQQALDANKKKPKKIIVDVYTDWCGWCKKMDKDTYDNPEIIKYINENYYAVKFNAENNGEVKFKDRVYKMPNTGGRATHEFTAVIMQGGGGYPTTCFFDNDLSILQSVSGYLDAKTMNMVLKYFGGNHHKTTEWSKYSATFK